MKLPHHTTSVEDPPGAGRPEGWYLFGVLPADSGLDLDDCCGFDHSRVQLVHCANLYALTGRIALTDPGGEPEPEQVTEQIVAHDRVLRAAVATGRAVVPLPFGMVTETLDDVRRLLNEYSAQLHSALARLEGCDEWGVHVSVPREAAQRAVRSCARQVYDRLASVAEDAVIEPVNAGAKEERPSILSAAYLVNRDRLAAFTQTVQDLQHAWDMAQFSISVSGPWPAYNFARVSCGVEPDEQAQVLLGPLSEPSSSWMTHRLTAAHDTVQQGD